MLIESNGNLLTNVAPYGFAAAAVAMMAYATRVISVLMRTPLPTDPVAGRGFKLMIWTCWIYLAISGLLGATSMVLFNHPTSDVLFALQPDDLESLNGARVMLGAQEVAFKNSAHANLTLHERDNLEVNITKLVRRLETLEDLSRRNGGMAVGPAGQALHESGFDNPGGN